MSKLLALIAPLALGAAALELVGMKVGDCRISLRSDSITGKTIYFADENRACLRFNLPFKNTGRQHGLLMDAACHLQPIGDRFSDLNPVCRWINREAPRQDGYWEAFILKPGCDLMTTVEIWLSGYDIRRKLKDLSTFRVDCSYKYYCRTPMKYRKDELTFQLDGFEEVGTLEPLVLQEDASEKTSSKAPGHPNVLPLKTKLLRPGDDLIEVIKLATEGRGKPGDLVAIAETVVAIVQGRIVYCEDIDPGYFAVRLSRLLMMDASLSSPYSMEMAIREVGLPRVLLAVAAGAIGKARGKAGEFYRVVGRSVTVIDDCTGTLPPFDKHVVMGPARGDQLCASIKAATGFEVAIVDANDLGKVDVLNISDPTRTDAVIEALKPNPQGNAGEMTPLVLIEKEYTPAELPETLLAIEAPVLPSTESESL